MPDSWMPRRFSCGALLIPMFAPSLRIRLRLPSPGISRGMRTTNKIKWIGMNLPSYTLYPERNSFIFKM